ncbi:probable carboxylesterase 9 [Euphorbia lathyris]|uniref:probable carboxylesterase 9 n=1 Tax=Euphorbia lathyris TaxID=212925 RepID=UPI0033134828
MNITGTETTTPTGTTTPATDFSYSVEQSKFDPYEQLHIQLNSDGESVTRLLNLPPANDNPDPDSGQAVLSKDIILNPQKKTTLRIFVSSKLTLKNTDGSRLPIIFYFHDAAWVQSGAKHFQVHMRNSYLSCSVPAIMLLVDYRLAPENRLPAQYEDAIDAFLWLKKQALDPKGEPWVKEYGDFSRCFLFGNGCGGNVVFNAALRAMDLDLTPIKIEGLVLNQPIFGGQTRMESELNYATDNILPLPALDLMWELALPKGMDRDHRFCNPLTLDAPHNATKLKALQRCLVIAFGMNPMFDRQQEFVKMLVKHGVEVQAQFDEIGFHRIELVDPRRAVAIDNLVKEFMNKTS